MPLFKKKYWKNVVTHCFGGKLTHSYSVKTMGAPLGAVDCLLMHFKKRSVYWALPSRGSQRLEKKGEMEKFVLQ